METERLTPDADEVADRFGMLVAVADDADIGFVGVPLDDTDNGSDVGSVSVFE